MDRSIEELDVFFDEIHFECPAELLGQLHRQFEEDFLVAPFKIKGLEVKVIDKPSRVEGFEGYPETFVHLITRKGSSGRRIYDPYRAQRLHWIKAILLEQEHEEIKYFEYEEDDGSIRDYYWYDEGNFLVIMEKVRPDYLIITSFHIDDSKSRKKYEKRYFQFLKKKGK